MNLHKVIDSNKLYDLYNQIFDYFSLTIYDLESKLDTNLSIEKFKKQLETFSDNHFKSALNEFNCEILKLKDQIPDDFTKIEKLSNDLKIYFNSFLERNLFDIDKINDLKMSLKNSLDKINRIYS